MPEDVPKELRVDLVEVNIRIGQWRGSIKLNEFGPNQPLRLFAKDDGQLLPFGRALEEAITDLLQRVQQEHGGSP